jgi:membrane-associated protease RseP (regulator of RpoE activity)
VRGFSEVTRVVENLTPSAPVAVAVDRAGTRVVLSVTPAASGNDAVLGVVSDPVMRPPSPARLVSDTTSLTWELMQQTASGMAGFVNAVTAMPANFISNDADQERLLSPVGAARIAESSVSTDGIYAPFALLAASSMFIGAFNLLPIPPLDGGHIAIATYEAVMTRIRRRQVRVSAVSLAPVIKMAVAMIVVLGVSSLVLDIFRPIALP